MEKSKLHQLKLVHSKLYKEQKQLKFVQNKLYKVQNELVIKSNYENNQKKNILLCIFLFIRILIYSNVF